MFIFLCMVSTSFVSHLYSVLLILFYLVSTIIINNTIIVFIFFSWGPFIVPSCNMFLLVVKCLLQLDWRFLPRGDCMLRS